MCRCNSHDPKYYDFGCERKSRWSIFSFILLFLMTWYSKYRSLVCFSFAATVISTHNFCCACWKSEGKCRILLLYEQMISFRYVVYFQYKEELHSCGVAMKFKACMLSIQLCCHTFYMHQALFFNSKENYYFCLLKYISLFLSICKALQQSFTAL